MALPLPRSVKALITSTPDATRIADGLSSALQPVLNFLNTTFDSAADNSLRIAKNVAFLGNVVINGKLTMSDIAANNVTVNGMLSAAGAATLGAGLTVTGLTTVRGDTSFIGSMTNWVPANASSVFVPAAAGVTLYATNVGNTSATFAVRDTGAVYARGGLAADDVISAPSFISSAGFKSVVSLGTYYNTATAGGQNFRTVDVIMSANANQLAYIYRKWGAPRPGSLTAISVVMNNAVPANLGWQIEKNGVLITQCVVPANKTVASVTINKGVLPFVAGDVFSCLINMPAGINFAGRIDIEVELGA